MERFVLVALKWELHVVTPVLLLNYLLLALGPSREQLASLHRQAMVFLQTLYVGLLLLAITTGISFAKFPFS